MPHLVKPFVLQRLVGAIALDFCVNTALLMVGFPIWREFQYRRHPPDHWIHVYSWAGLLSTAIILVVNVAVYLWNMRRSTKISTIWNMWITFGVLCCLAIAIGTSLPYGDSSWPDIIQDIDAQFFAEFGFLRFIFYDASLMSLAAGLLSSLAYRNRSSAALSRHAGNDIGVGPKACR